MFIKKFAESDMLNAVESNIKHLESRDEDMQKEYLNRAIKLVELSATLLDECGCEKEAAKLDKMLESLAHGKKHKEESDENEVVMVDSLGHKKKDPHIPTSSKQALKNLEEKGWMFNADDTLVVHDDAMAKTCAYCGQPVDQEDSHDAYCSKSCSDAAMAC